MKRSLEGDWRVERLAGALPPMVGVWKRIRSGGGLAWVGPLPVWPFRLEQREERVALIYGRPFSLFIDEVWPQADGSWLGRSTLGGHEFGRFRMVRYEPMQRKPYGQ